MANPSGSEALRLALELREPLHAVGGLAALLAEADDTSELESLGDHIVDQTSRMATIIDELIRELKGSDPVAPEPTAQAVTEPILIVDDSPVNRSLTESQLMALGYTSTSVSSGPEALEFLQSTRVALILLDWNMPAMDGLETATKLREHEAATDTDRVPVIALTARAMDGDREACLAAGMDDFLSKPVELQELGNAIRRWLVVGASEPPPSDAATQTPGTARPTTRPDSDLDDKILDYLEVELGDRSILDLLLRTFLDELPGRLASIKAAATSNDLTELRQTAHTLKSTSDMFGAGRLTVATRSIEDASRSGTGVSQAVVDELFALAEIVLVSITERLDTESG